MKIYLDSPTAIYLRRCILHPVKLAKLQPDIRERFEACLGQDDRGSYVNPSEMMGNNGGAALLFVMAILDAGEPGTRWVRPMMRLADQFREGLGASAVDRLAEVIEDRSKQFKVRHPNLRAKATKIIRDRTAP